MWIHPWLIVFYYSGSTLLHLPGAAGSYVGRLSESDCVELSMSAFQAQLSSLLSQISPFLTMLLARVSLTLMLAVRSIGDVHRSALLALFLKHDVFHQMSRVGVQRMIITHTPQADGIPLTPSDLIYLDNDEISSNLNGDYDWYSIWRRFLCF